MTHDVLGVAALAAGAAILVALIVGMANNDTTRRACVAACVPVCATSVSCTPQSCEEVCR